MRYPAASGANINDSILSLYAATIKIRNAIRAGAMRSVAFSMPAGICRDDALGFLLSMCLSMTLLATIPTVRAPTMAVVIHINFDRLGRPLAARSIPTYANGRAKILSLNFIASRKAGILENPVARFDPVTDHIPSSDY